ncbi:MAG TPA: divalent metal cation transporter, partial [Streptosporangiaceae bacterium]|nr:divalent metal cation transporter [Streptosporangiaceae bacterium]
RQAPWFYGVYAAVVVVSAVIVLMPGNPLGLIIEAVAALNGVLLPIALVFLLLLANDRPVLGPWVNGPWQNAITGVIVWCMVALSLATTATYFFPDLSLTLLAVGLLTAAGVGMIGGLVVWRLQSRRPRIGALAGLTREESKAELSRLRTAWRTPRLDTLDKPVLSPLRKAGLVTLRAYVVLSVVLLIIKIISLA